MEKIREKKLVYYIENRSIKISFILYALISLVVGITISVTAIALVDNYRMNLNYKYEDMTTRYDIPENGSFIAKYNNDQTEYTIYNAVSRFFGNLIYLFKALCIAFILKGTLFLTISETYRAASPIVMKNSGWLSKESRQ